MKEDTITSSVTQRQIPIVAEIIRNALVSVSNEMKIDLMRSSYNPIIYEMLDFSVGLFSEKAETLAQAAGLPQFLCDMPNAVRSILEDIGGVDNVCEGDIYLTNDPYTSSFHLNDVTVVEPVFYDGRVVAFAGARAHWHDMGGKSAGGSSDATNVYQEGLFLRSIKLFSAGERDENVIRIIQENSRLPNAVVGDLNAQVASCHTGVARLTALIDRYGLDVFSRSVDLMIANGEELARAAVRDIPDGDYFAEGFLDNDGVELDRRLNVAVTVKVRGDEIEFDLTGTDGPCKGPLNANRHITRSELSLVFKTLTTPTEPANDGHFRPLKVTLPDGCLLDAQRPSPTLLAFVPLELLIDLVRKALADAIPEKVTAADYGRCCVMHAAGRSPRDGSFIIIADTEGGGWGAKPFGDGENALLFGDIRVIPVEVLEHKYPVVLDRFALREDSGGPGTFRGGLGVVKDYRLTDELELLTGYDRHDCPPWGLFGGQAGAPNTIVVTRADGSTDEFRKATEYRLAAGDVVSFRTGGGGGYGEPMDRDPARVLRDVVGGYVSVESARDDYGVVLTDGGLGVDRDATSAARAERLVGGR
ncbi:MAG: hydantoinase B/oxoprolinase family protein [Actinomycetia bacterium]|nr:hydantoinase B/oxoprolinase family protein [Actinomycetes bacterium]